MKTNVAIEISEDSALKTKTCLSSFIGTNPWFSGTVYLLTSSRFPVSEKTFTEISNLYAKTERVKIDSDERITQMMSVSNQLLESSLLSHLKLGAFLIEGPVVYLSQKTLVLTDLSFFMTSDLSFSNLSNQDSPFIFYLSGNLNKTEILSSLFNSIISEKKIPPNKRLSNSLSIEFKKIVDPNPSLDERLVAASSYLDRYFNKLKSSLNRVACLYFEDSVFNSPLYTKINQIWLHKARSTVFSMNRPSSSRLHIPIPKKTKRPSAPPPPFKDDGFSISIIIPAFKAQSYIKECLDSIKGQQTMATIEILIGVDNCKETLIEIQKIMKDYPNLRVFFSNKSIGAYVMRNSLVEFSKHENILFFDADDIMSSRMVTTILQKYHKQRPIRFRYLNFNHGNDHMTNSSLNHGTSHGVFFISRELFNKVGGFQDWPCGADTEFMKRCLNNKIHDLNLSDPLFYRRVHPLSLTQNSSTGFKSKVRNEIITRIKNTKVWPIPINRVTSKLEQIA